MVLKRFFQQYFSYNVWSLKYIHMYAKPLYIYIYIQTCIFTIIPRRITTKLYQTNFKVLYLDEYQAEMSKELKKHNITHKVQYLKTNNTVSLSSRKYI